MSSPSAARSTTITCSTWGSAEHARLSRAVFGNCEWPMEFYIAHAHGAFAGLCRKLPLRRFWGLVSREFRMGFLVQRKVTPSCDSQRRNRD